jgi:hypothetical protein
MATAAPLMPDSGTVSGSVGIVLLKKQGARWPMATRSNVIEARLSTATTPQIGYTAPSIDDQAEVIAEAQAVAEFSRKP